MTFNFDDFATCPGEPGFGYGTFEVPNSTTSGQMNMYSGTRLSVNTFYMQLEQETGVVRALRDGQVDGRRPHQPAAATNNGLGAS